MKEQKRRVLTVLKGYREKWGIRWPLFYLAAHGFNLLEIEREWSIPKVFAMLDAVLLMKAMG